MRKLNLESNRISYIDPNAFIELRNYLEELYIDVDHIGQIPQSIFSLANLKILKLNGFQLNDFSLQNLQKLKKLEKFYLTNCKIVNVYGFQTQADAIQQLKLLSLQSNRIEIIDESLFNYLYNLEILNLNDNNLTYLNFNLKNLTKLHALDLSYNGIAKLNANLFDIKQNANLQRLLLNNNELTSIKQKFFKNLVGLRELNIDFNKLATLESNVFLNNNQLEILSINNNFLSDIGEQAFNGLKTSLQRLHLSRNKLKHLSEDRFIYTTSLQQLYLDRNQLTALNKNTFFGLETTLTELNLQFNKIKILNGSVRFLRSLQKLRLNNNQIESLGFSNEFENCLNLTYLNMELNSIRQLPDLTHVQTRFTVLHELDLTSNYICTINQLNKFKDKFPNLRLLKLNNNQLKCDCDLIELKVYFGYLNDALAPNTNSPTSQYDVNTYQCQLPSSLMGANLMKLNETQLVCDATSKTETFANCTTGPALAKYTDAVNEVRNNHTNELISDILIDLNLASNLLNISWLLNEEKMARTDDDFSVKYFLLNSRIFNKFSNELVFHLNKYIMPTNTYFEIRNFNFNTTQLSTCKVSICVSVVRKSSQEKYCKNFYLNDTHQPQATNEPAVTSQGEQVTFKNLQQQKTWFNLFDQNQVYGIIGALLGILLAFFLAFLFYYLKIRRLNDSNVNDKQRNFYESTILNDQLLGSGDSATTTTSTTAKQKCPKVDFQHVHPQMILSSALMNPNLTLTSSAYSPNSNHHTLSSMQHQQRKFFLQQLNNPNNPTLTYHIYHEIPDNMITPHSTVNTMHPMQPPSYSAYSDTSAINNYFPNRTSSFNTNTLSSYKPIFLSGSNTNS